MRNSIPVTVHLSFYRTRT